MDFSHSSGRLTVPPWRGGATSHVGGSHLQALSGGTIFSHSDAGLGVSDPGCALSLLSTLPLDYSSGSASRNLIPAESFAREPWALKGHNGGSSAVSGEGQFSNEPSPESMGRVSGFSGGHLPWLP